ncbi:MAG: 2-hydroxyacid dehydrogenase [Gammaproteobacteria bacterium]|nr:2-hydroxyacid dehydrogenase [Gammaproteobacteria bacterium]
MTKPHILSFETYDEWDSVPMQEAFTVHAFPEGSNPADIALELREQIRAFAFKGHEALGADIIDAFPNLGLIANYGVGYDTIDVAHATSKGVKVTNTPDVLTDDVADLAVGMLLALSRDIVGASDWVRSGRWTDSGAFPLQRTISGMSVGSVGLGRIGRAVANRLQAFNTRIHYFARGEKDTPGWTYHANLLDLATEVDIMMVAVSGGDATAGLISADVIEALGPDGLLINSARGTTLDEEALIQALQNNRLRGAALDVFNNEPHIDPRFSTLDNVLLQPHQSSGTVETRKRMGELQRQNLMAFFASEPLVTPVN